MFTNGREFMKFLTMIGIVFSSFTIISNSPSVQTVSRATKQTYPPQQVEKASVNLNFSPKDSTIRADDDFKINILINAGGNPVMGTDLILSYDPQVLSPFKIEPGGFFSNPQVIKEIVDNSLGKIAYAVGSFQASSGQGIVATVSFKTLVPAKLGKTEVAFAQDTDVAIRGEKNPLTILSNPGSYTILR